MLCQKKAYVIKRVGVNPPRHARTGQITWSLYEGPGHAWKVAKLRSHFDF